jgi:hypothetical protein
MQTGLQTLDRLRILSRALSAVEEGLYGRSLLHFFALEQYLASFDRSINTAFNANSENQ